MKKNNTPRRLFFYASRQLWRRRRTYLAVFAVSVVLLALVMAALELFESYHLQSLEIASAGTHHAAIYDQPNDWSEEIMKDGGVTSVTVIPQAARSNFPARVSSINVGQEVGTYSSSTPSEAARSSASSTSNPQYSPVSGSL